MSVGVLCVFWVVPVDGWTQLWELFHVHPELGIYWNILLSFLKSLASRSLSFVVLQIFGYGSFVGINVLKFWWNPVWQVFSCYDLAFGVVSKTSPPDPRSRTFHHHFPLKAFVVLCFTPISVWVILFWRQSFAIQPRLDLNPQFSCLSLPCTRIAGVCCPSW